MTTHCGRRMKRERADPYAIGRVCAAMLLVAVTASGSPAKAPQLSDPIAIEITARPIDHFHIGHAGETRFGALQFIGGLELESRNRHFGALSGLAVTNGGKRLIAVTDNGFWMTAAIDYDNSGRPTAITDALMTPMQDGRPDSLIDRGRGDAEGVALDTSTYPSRVIVAFERDHRIMETRLDEAGRPGILTGRIALPNLVKFVRYNKGIEAVAVAPALPGGQSKLLAIAERARPAGAPMPGWIVRGAGPEPFHVRRIGPFDATDAAFLDNGDLLLLERRFNLKDGIGMRIRRIAGATIKPGAVLDGPVLIEADFSHQIDNMEGLAVHRAADGSQVLTLISDDNRSILQRSLLLQFRLIEGD